MELMLRELTEMLLAPFNLAELAVKVTSEEDAEGMLHLKVFIATRDAPVLIGRYGDTLASLQHLIKLMASRKVGEDKRFTLLVDVDGYLEKKADSLVEKARFKASQVATRGTPAELPAVNAYLRRKIHVMIAEEFPDLTTESLGNGAVKTVVIKKK